MIDLVNINSSTQNSAKDVGCGTILLDAMSELISTIGSIVSAIFNAIASLFCCTSCSSDERPLVMSYLPPEEPAKNQPLPKPCEMQIQHLGVLVEAVMKTEKIDLTPERIADTIKQCFIPYLKDRTDSLTTQREGYAIFLWIAKALQSTNASNVDQVRKVFLNLFKEMDRLAPKNYSFDCAKTFILIILEKIKNGKDVSQDIQRARSLEAKNIPSTSAPLRAPTKEPAFSSRPAAPTTSQNTSPLAPERNMLGKAKQAGQAGLEKARNILHKKLRS